jgi:hypothetical protein
MAEGVRCSTSHLRERPARASTRRRGTARRTQDRAVRKLHRNSAWIDVLPVAALARSRKERMRDSMSLVSARRAYQIGGGPVGSDDRLGLLEARRWPDPEQSILPGGSVRPRRPGLAIDEHRLVEESTDRWSQRRCASLRARSGADTRVRRQRGRRSGRRPKPRPRRASSRRRRS